MGLGDRGRLGRFLWLANEYEVWILRCGGPGSLVIFCVRSLVRWKFLKSSNDFLKFFFCWGKTQVWKPNTIHVWYLLTDIYHKNQPFMQINIAVPWMSPWMVWESVCCYRLRHIRCAYEYGVPQASGQFYSGDGPYDGGVWDAERHLVDPWKLGKDGQFLQVVVSNIFLSVYPENWGKLIQIDFAHMFQMGWSNYHPDLASFFFSLLNHLFWVFESDPGGPHKM